MQHFSCDLCQKPIGEDRYTVAIDLFAAPTSPSASQLTEEDLSEDNLQALSDMLDAERIEPSSYASADEALRQTHQYDLCPTCRTEVARDPLGVRRRGRLQFSDN